MTIEDQIKDEKLQYNINKEANIEQAKFTYSPLGKAFNKQTKTIEEQGKKQAEALANLKLKEIKPKATKPNEYGDYFLNGLAKIRESSETIDFNNSIYSYKGNSAPIKFIGYKGPIHIFKSIHNGDISLEDIKKSK